MTTKIRPEFEFEDIIAELFAREDFGVERQPQARAGVVPDLIVRAGGQVSVVEIKFYRARRLPFSALAPAVGIAATWQKRLSAAYAVVIVSARVSAEANARAFDANVVVIDYDWLSILLAPHADLSARFDDLVRSTSLFPNGGDDLVRGDAWAFLSLERLRTAPDVPDTAVPRIAMARGQASGQATVVASPAVPSEGARLCAELRAIVPAGKGATRELRARLAGEFEKKCVECLRHLFRDNFAGDHTQYSTEERLSRFDYIVRLRPLSDFWRVLQEDFGSRYVVFEFKHFAGLVSQGEILTTEKYLYGSALRSVAIIISPKGFHRNAKAMARGALREHGKLILSLTVDQLCTMLHASDGDVPEGESADIDLELLKELDRTLMSVER